MPTKCQVAPIEPVLKVNDIQGMALPGFLKPHSMVVGLELPRSQRQLTAFRQLLPTLAGELSTAAKTLADRRRHRARKSGKPSSVRSSKAIALAGLAFNYSALKLFASDAGKIDSPAFKIGLAGRSRLLGDPANHTSEGNPANWVFGGDPVRPTLLLVVAADTRDLAEKRGESLIRMLRSVGCSVCYRENGDIRSDLPGHEHFGFSDGISQPGVRGRASDRPSDFITPRHIHPREKPEAWLYGYPGQDLVWPGEFILGYPGSAPNPLQPGPTAACIPRWTRNGSFLVFRRLRQDVALFWQTMRKEARLLCKRPGFSGLDEVALASLLVGRWPSGAPLSRVPQADNAKLGADPLANNHFRLDSECKLPGLAIGKVDRFRKAKADPLGFACPCASHIRKLNTRDSASDMGGRETTFRARILRAGIPFGPPLTPDLFHSPRQADAARGNRGLLFMCLQASIENQFEFLQTRWLNDPVRPRMPGGRDLLVGQNPAVNEHRVRRAVVFDRNRVPVELSISAEWIVPTGGGYFFVPSISAIRRTFGTR